ncbi:hypothetical protein R3P38DRAFT_3429833 [Favolaschia claudopus]|uniref:Uncharacterized protein n=1 Tax=Favolaschia claudopus TaxID=2862362 RepID=A0AAV9ZV34_9AGAR
MSQYMQVIADVCLFNDLTNDVLSFHKEELAGEMANYIHNCAGVTGKAPTYVLAELGEEALAARDRVTMALRACGSQGLDVWSRREQPSCTDTCNDNLRACAFGVSRILPGNLILLRIDTS